MGRARPPRIKLGPIKEPFIDRGTAEPEMARPYQS
jgi:hypothetical protein